MKHHAILNPEVQQFIRDHEKEDEHQLLLKHKTLFNIPFPQIADQLVGRRKARTKLPTFYHTPNLIYPPGINLEQSSSEATAKFKTEFIKNQRAERKSIADLTGGFGVDALYFSKHFEKVLFVEPNPELIGIARHNLQQLGSTNISYYNITAEEFLATAEDSFDWIYIDPSRRDNGSKKIVKLSESSPDVTKLLTTLFTKTNQILIKTSPLMDIRQGVNELQNVSSVLVVSVDNECKEVLFHCTSNPSDLSITAVDLNTASNTTFTFSLDEEQLAPVQYAKPDGYLYEPNASILKAGAFKTVAQRFNIFKIHSNTHLYTSDKLLPDFPGRIFRIEQHIKPEPKIIENVLPEKKANVLTRNYPLSPEALKQKVKIKDGGEKFLIGFTGTDKKYVVVASRL